ncbi:hypothetical protein [Nocardia sp. NPDC050710]|uniref:DUF7373 family lipoprotein n=1 Tax=Nocardia sp. NPDC050710 TaxID=3157220 RepID=UPI0033ED7059
MKRLRMVAALAVTLVVGAGCANSINGSPQPGLAPVDLAVLKTGGNVTEPTPFKLRLSDGARNVRMIESRHLLNYLVHPFDVDSDLTDLGNVRLIADPYSMTADGAFPRTYKPIAEKYDILAGAYAGRTNGSLRATKKLIVSILRFPTEAVAASAADEFDRITGEAQQRYPIPIDGYPQARATSSDEQSILSFQPHGPYVIVSNASLPQPNRDQLAGMVKKTLDLQIAQLDKQQPTPLDDLLDLPIDPDGIMRRTAPKSKESNDPFFGFFEDDFGTFQAAGILHYLRNPIEVRKVLEEGGVDLVGNRASTVYRTRDLAAAVRLQTALTRLTKNDETLDPPPGLIDATCVRLDILDPNRSFTSFCAVVYQRYVAIVIASAPQLARVDRALQERTAAQYSILAKSE